WSSSATGMRDSDPAPASIAGMTCRTWGILAVIAAVGSAHAQDLGLDLSDTTDYRPTLAIVGIAPTDPAVSPEMGEKLKVDKVSARLVETAQKSDLFATVTAPGDVYGKISDS